MGKRNHYLCAGMRDILREIHSFNVYQTIQGCSVASSGHQTNLLLYQTERPKMCLPEAS